MVTPRLRAPALAAAVLACTTLPVQAFRIDYTLDAGVEHDDNVHVEAVDPDAQRILRAGLGFLATQEGSAVQAVVAGRADYRDFQDGASDGLEGMLSAYLNWVMVPDRLSFTLQDELELQAIDRFAADSPDNRQQINVLSLGPNLLFDIGNLHGRLEARYIDTDAEVSEAFNSGRVAAALRMTRDLDTGTTLSGNAQWMDVDYDHDLLARDHRRADLYARYARSRANVDYAIDAGWSRLEYDDGERRDGPLLRLEAGWRPGDRGRLSLVAVDHYSDAADTALASGASARPEATVPGSLLVDDSTIIPSAYREQRVALAYAHAGERLGLRIEPYVQRLRYVDAGVSDEEIRGVLVGIDYRITPTLSLSGWAGVERIEYDSLGVEEDLRRGGFALHRQWTRHWSTSLSWYRYERDILGSEVRQNVWYLWMSYRSRAL